MARVLVVATSRKTRGGITAVIKAHEKGRQWKDFRCHWIQTHRDGPQWRKLLYLGIGFFDYLLRLPFANIVHIHFSLQTTAKRKMPFVKLAKLLNKKVIAHLHCGSQIDEIWNERYQYIFTNSDVSLLLSESLKGKIESHIGGGHDLRVCFNPCPIVKHQQNDKKNPHILFSGTLYEGKGFLDLIKAFSLIASEHQDWKLIFAGNGEIERGTKLAEELGIRNQVDFLGWVTGFEKDKVFRESSIFCLPSYAEGFPMAVLDAWAYGLPVVTTPVGGIPDIAKNGENLLLFNPGDINMLAEQLDRMISDGNLRNAISKQSVILANTTFNQDTVNRQLYDLYSELLSK